MLQHDEAIEKEKPKKDPDVAAIAVPSILAFFFYLASQRNYFSRGKRDRFSMGKKRIVKQQAHTKRTVGG